MLSGFSRTIVGNVLQALAPGQNSKAILASVTKEVDKHDQTLCLKGIKTGFIDQRLRTLLIPPSKGKC